MTNPKLRFRQEDGTSFAHLFSETLGNVVNIERGGSPRPIDAYLTDDPEGLNWIKIGDAPVDGTRITSVKERIKPEGLKKTRQVQKGDLILSNSMSFGRPYLLEVDGCIHDGWLVIRNSKQIFDVEYLLYLLSSKTVRKQYKSLAGAGVVTNLNKELVQQVQVSIPSLSEQQKVADFFVTLDQKIALAERKLTALQALKAGLMQKIFSQEIRFKREDGSPYPTWVSKPLSELARVGDIDHRMPKSVTEGIPYLMTGDFAGKSEIKFDNVKQISEDDYKLLSKKIKPEKGDTILARYASVGAAMYVDFDTRFLVSYSCVIIKPAEKINSKFLFYCLMSEYVQKQIKNEINASSQANIGMASVKKLQVVSPTLEEQNRIAAVLSAVDDKIRFATKKVDLLKQQKQAFLQQMFV